MENLSDHDFIIDGWKVTPADGLLTREGESVRLEPKVMDVLVYFASHPGEVISRMELEREVWRGAVVGYDAVSATVIKLRKALQDKARNPHIIATIPKKGYKLIATVTFVDIGEKETASPKVQSSDTPVSSPHSAAESSAQTSTQKRPSFNLQMTVAIALMAIALAITWTKTGKQSLNVMPSLVVLPIENLDANNQYDVFLDGITDDIITDLSRLSSLKVFASATTFKYKGQQISPQSLRQEINADFVLSGSARRHGDDIRINVQLAETKNGQNIWAQRYDQNVIDIFDLQDTIAKSLIEALAIEVLPKEKHNISQRATKNLKAYEYFLEGQRISRDQTKQSNALAREAYLQAVETDPAYGRAYGALAYILALDYRHGWTDSPIENLDHALSLAEKGVALNSSIPQTYWSLSYVHLRRNEYEAALKAAEESIKVSPNYADGYGLLALISNGLGQADKALAYATRGMQLNPYYTWDYLFNVGYSHYLLGDYTKAIESLQKAGARNENALPVKLFLAAAYAHTGRLDDAEWMVDQIGMLNSATTISHIANTVTQSDPKLKSMLIEDLRKAGLPEE